MPHVFSNFQNSKLEVIKPDQVNILILGIFALMMLLSFRKKDTYPSDFLNLYHTEQLKGLAIFFVTLGHLWTHVSKSQASFSFAQDAVSLFLILSGFGLTISTYQKRPTFYKFWYRRIRKIMIPYWISTILIVILDFALLKKIIPLDNLVMTIFGINLKVELRHLDYVRWYVTFILLWYLLFSIANMATQNIMTKFYLLLIFSFSLFPFHYYILDVGWYNFFSFPLGCLLAIYYKQFARILLEKKSICIFLCLVGLGYVLAFKYIMSNSHIFIYVTNLLPTILRSFIYECNSLIFNCVIVFLSGYIYMKGFSSNLLVLLGKYSYEIFLLHGVFLIKYNPIFKYSGNIAIVVEFFVFISFVAFLSFILSKITVFVNAFPKVTDTKNS